MFNNLTTLTTSNSTTSEVFFIYELGTKSEFYKVNLDPGAQTDIAESFKKAVEKSIIEPTTGIASLHKVSSLSNNASNIYEYDILPKSEVFSLMESIGSLKVSSSIKAFDFSTQPLENVKGIVIRLTDGTENLYIYQHKHAVSLHKKSALSFLSLQGNILTRVEHDIINISKNIDFFMYNDTQYIVNLKRLESSYGLNIVIDNMVAQAVPKIVALNIIDMTPHSDPDKIFDDLKKNRSCMKKIAKVLNGTILSGGAGITINQIQTICSDFPLFGRNIVFTNNLIDLGSQKKKLFFIRMLNDEAVRSALTNDVSLADDRESAA